MPFEITVVEQSFDENVTGKSVKADLAAAAKAAHARAAYEQVLRDEEPTGLSDAERAAADAGIRAALELVKALGGDNEHFRVTIAGGDRHINVNVQEIDPVVPPADAEPTS